MTKLITNPKISNAIGFVILPIILFVLCMIANFFAPTFPKPQIIFEDIIRSFGEKSFIYAIGNTIFVISKVLLFSLIFGGIIGLFLGSTKVIWSFSQPTIDFFRSIPVTFLLPGVALLIGSKSSNIVWILATYPCILIVIFNIRTGIEKQVLQRVHSFYIINGSINKTKRFFKVTLYEILPEIFSGFRIALSYSIVVVTVLEFMLIGNKSGIGGMIYDEMNNQNYVRVYALTFIVGIFGFLLNKIIEIIQYRVVHWSTEIEN
ncbi:MAG: hypothetical protein Q8M15_16890 [Bacteroidota bacterium]|nr:hypothetical protein [Bacteroidota bacterium]